MTGVDLIAAERARQVSVEGWTSEHDDGHDDAALAYAAACYAVFGAHYDLSNPELRSLWPWEAEWWKPSTDRIRNLAKAGALIAAEIDRLERLRS